MTHPINPAQKKSNLRLALVLVSVVAVFFCGFMIKITLLGKA